MTEDIRTGSGALGIITAFLGGALAGSLAALLLAPRSGKDTRKMIGDTVIRQKDRASRLGVAARDAGVAAKEAFTETMAGGH